MSEKDKETKSYAIYIDRTGNGKGHEVLQMLIVQAVSVNKIIIISINNDHIQRMNQTGVLDGQLDGIIISNSYRDITINNLDIDAGDDNSNASDNDIKFEDAHQREREDN